MTLLLLLQHPETFREPRGYEIHFTGKPGEIWKGTATFIIWLPLLVLSFLQAPRRPWLNPSLHWEVEISRYCCICLCSSYCLSPPLIFKLHFPDSARNCQNCISWHTWEGTKLSKAALGYIMFSLTISVLCKYRWQLDGSKEEWKNSLLPHNVHKGFLQAW